MTALNVRIYSDWPLYREDEISEWFEEYEKTIELFTELMNLHGGVRCWNTQQTTSPIITCEICKQITGDELRSYKYLTFINQHESPEDR